MSRLFDMSETKLRSTSFASLPHTPPESEYTESASSVCDEQDITTTLENYSRPRRLARCPRKVSAITNITDATGISSLPDTIISKEVVDVDTSLNHDLTRARPVVDIPWNTSTIRASTLGRLDGLVTPSSTRSPRTSILTGDGRRSRPRGDRRQRLSHVEDTRDFHHEPHYDVSESVTATTAEAPPPLVLLHVTIIPSSQQYYSTDELHAVGASDCMLESQRLLRTKLEHTVMDRGILIAHPADDFGLLEERVLEALELIPPRVLSCGHFYVDEDDEMCSGCEEPMRLPGRGLGVDGKRWNVKVYAANGLMKAGAWGAAWQEMERVDVEVTTWLPEDIKRKLNVLREVRASGDDTQGPPAERGSSKKPEESGHHDHPQSSTLEVMSDVLDVVKTSQRQAEEIKLQAEVMMQDLRALLLEIQTQPRSSKSRHAPMTTAHTRDDDDNSDAMHTSRRSSSKTPVTVIEHQETFQKERTNTDDIPLRELLRNCAYILLQDRRNILLCMFAGVFVLLGLAWLGVTGPSSVVAPDPRMWKSRDVTGAGLGSAHRGVLAGSAPVPAVSASEPLVIGPVGGEGPQLTSELPNVGAAAVGMRSVDRDAGEMLGSLVYPTCPIGSASQSLNR